MCQIIFLYLITYQASYCYLLKTGRGLCINLGETIDYYIKGTGILNHNFRHILAENPAVITGILSLI